MQENRNSKIEDRKLKEANVLVLKNF